jgi:hypothetical protein
VIPRRVWGDYAEPVLPPIHVSLCLPDLRKLKASVVHCSHGFCHRTFGKFDIILLYDVLFGGLEREKNNLDMAVGVRIGTYITNIPCMTNEM